MIVWVSFLALVLWFPVVLYLFERFPTQKAITFSFITAWLFLPSTQIPLSGFPDWSKTTATVFSVSLCVWVKQSQRLLGIRWQWYDLPVLIYCLCPFMSSITNGLGAYDGLSAVLDELFRWGLPYTVGRAFLGTLAGNRQLTLGIAAGGFLYIPFCLIEIRLSPMMKSWVYGIYSGGGMEFFLRYGGYRPMVFLANGLELGWWMCCATLSAYALWVSGSVKRFNGMPMGVLTAVLAVTTVACKSTGALVQIAMGFFLIYFCKFTKNSWLVWALVAIPPMYCVARPTGIWTGERMVDLAASAFGAERAQSLGFRFENEEILMRSAMQRMVFGWGRFGGFNSPDEYGLSATTDGLWIIVFGWMGGVGLVSLNLMLIVPTMLFLSRFRPSTWLDIDVAPVTALAIILPLFMLDNLSNAMINPIYALAMGSVAGFRPSRVSHSAKSGRPGMSQSLGELGTHAAQRPVRFNADHDAIANQFETDAVAAAEQHQFAEARTLFVRALRSRQSAVDRQSSSDRLDRLATTHSLYARLLTQMDQIQAAVQERDRARILWKEIQDGNAKAEFSRQVYTANLNDLAWLLAADAHAAPAAIDRAVLMAEEAVGTNGEFAPYWNTLGIVRYRRRDYYKAIHALSRSVSLSQDGGNAFDFFYLAMANQNLGYPAPALAWLDRAESWTTQHPELSQLLTPVQAEASEVFGRVRNS